jgi:hypothetical protein
LEGSGELKTVGRNHPIIVVGGRHEGGGVGSAGFEVMEGGVAVEDGEILRVICTAILRTPSPANGKAMKPQHI